MSRRKGPEINFNPLLGQVQCDISFLCYLGLHQYAKENKLIGRSRPMITKELDLTKQRRLNFRLLVACIQQIVGSTHITHGEREEQINYVNVGNYAQLRLYGLLDRDIFAIDTGPTSSLTGYWPHQLAHEDVRLLKQQAEIDTLLESLSYNVRAILEIGGPMFVEHLRNALSYIPEELIELSPHQQRHPKERMRVKNLSLNLQLVESRPYRYLTPQPGPDRFAPVAHQPGFVDVPCHIERLLYFKHTLWPWVQELAKPEAREAFKYVSDNFPSMPAIQLKITKIRQSTAEQERREREAEEAQEEREQAQARLRERLTATYGDRLIDFHEDDMNENEPVEEGEPYPTIAELLGNDDEDDNTGIAVPPDLHAGQPITTENAENIVQRLIRILGETEYD